MENKMYVISEVAKELRVTYRSMQRYIADKKINAVKIGNKWMISQRELNYIKKNGLREPVVIVGTRYDANEIKSFLAKLSDKE